MGVFGALNAAVSGLRAQGSALENISGNIANSQTTGFKRQDSSFFELVAGSASTQANQVAGSVTFASRATNDLQGDIQKLTPLLLFKVMAILFFKNHQVRLMA